MTNSRVRSVVLAIAASLHAGCATAIALGHRADARRLPGHAGSGAGMRALRRVSGVCAPSTLHPAGKTDTGCGFDQLEGNPGGDRRHRRQMSAISPFAVLQLEAMPAAARRRYMALAGLRERNEFGPSAGAFWR